MAKKASGATNVAPAKAKRRSASAPVDQPMDLRELAREREALKEASALSPANTVPEAQLSPGVRVALERIFGADEQPRLGRVAERSAVYGAVDVAGGGLPTLASSYGVTLEALAERMDLSVDVVRTPFSDCPPALLAEVAQALRAPLAEVALALQADGEQKSGYERTFASSISEAPSLSEEQRRHWLALLATDPA
jgi:hypothetical protein